MKKPRRKKTDVEKRVQSETMKKWWAKRKQAERDKTNSAAHKPSMKPTSAKDILEIVKRLQEKSLVRNLNRPKSDG